MEGEKTDYRKMGGGGLIFYQSNLLSDQMMDNFKEWVERGEFRRLTAEMAVEHGAKIESDAPILRKKKHQQMRKVSEQRRSNRHAEPSDRKAQSG